MRSVSAINEANEARLFMSFTPYLVVRPYLTPIDLKYLPFKSWAVTSLTERGPRIKMSGLDPEHMTRAGEDTVIGYV